MQSKSFIEILKVSDRLPVEPAPLVKSKFSAEAVTREMKIKIKTRLVHPQPFQLPITEVPVASEEIKKAYRRAI